MLSFLLLYKNPYFLRLQQSIVVLSVLASSSMPNDKSISLQSPSTLPIYVDTQAVLKYIIKKNKYMLPLLSSKKKSAKYFCTLFYSYSFALFALFARKTRISGCFLSLKKIDFARSSCDCDILLDVIMIWRTILLTITFLKFILPLS